MDKIMFWKKDDDFDFDKLTDTNFDESKPLQDETDLDKNNADPFGSQDNQTTPTSSSPFNQSQDPSSQQSSFKQNSQLFNNQTSQQNNQQHNPDFNYQLPNRELELISSKLDTIKAILMSLDQRTSNLERIAGVGKKNDGNNLW